MITYNQKYIEIINQINSHKFFYTREGKLNSAYFRRDHFINSELCKNIIESTNFLKQTAPMSERIHCILKNITNLPVCICGKELTFITNTIGYKSSCSKCIRKVNKTWKSCKETVNINIKKEKEDLFNYIIDDNTHSSSLEEAKSFVYNRSKEIKRCLKCVYRTDTKVNKHILKRIVEETSYIKLDKDNYNWSCRFYNILHNTHEGKICEMCNINKTGFISLIKGYSIACSNKKCTQKHSATNRTNGHIRNILPMIREQGFEIDLKKFNGLNKEKTELFCNNCKTHIKCDISDGGWKNIRCYNCFGKNGTSYEEKSVLKYIKEYETNVLENVRIYENSTKELDIYIPDKNLAVEYNGSRWHSFGTSFPNNFHLESNSRNNHFEKYKKCNEMSINLLQINSYEWNNKNKNSIWRSIINNKLGYSKKIYARKCEIVELDNKTKNDFLNINHLQGMDNSKIKLGLKYEGSIVSVMTFAKPRFNKNYQWELVRFCNLLNYSVVGGATKLLNYFLKNYNPKNLISYADLRYSNGDLYKKLGFSFKSYTPPSYVYIKNDNILSRFSCQKNKLSKLLENFDESKTESQNMVDNGYRKMWDCGTMLFVYKS